MVDCDLSFQVNHQRAQLLEATRQNGELAEALQKKEEELEQLSAGLGEQENGIEQREGVIKILSEKEEEQSNIIKILRNNIELRSHTDNNVSTFFIRVFKAVSVRQRIVKVLGFERFQTTLNNRTLFCKEIAECL